MEIWFNPSCSKCQHAVETVRAAGEPYTLRTYLDAPPTEADLEEVLAKLGMQPWELCRMKEPVAKELGLASMGKDVAEDRARWIRLMVDHPILIERPILVLPDGRAVIGRTDEALEKALRGSR